MKRELQGRYVTISTAGEKTKAFVPAPLPPRPPIEWTPELRNKFDQALLALGRLDSVSTLAAGHITVPLHVCSQGGGALLHDRGDAVLAVRPATV